MRDGDDWRVNGVGHVGGPLRSDFFLAVAYWLAKSNVLRNDRCDRCWVLGREYKDGALQSTTVFTS